MAADKVRATYGAELLAEVLFDCGGYMEVLKMLPPDGMVVRDLTGSVYMVSIYKQTAESEARSLES